MRVKDARFVNFHAHFENSYRLSVIGYQKFGYLLSVFSDSFTTGPQSSEEHREIILDTDEHCFLLDTD